MIIKDDCVGGVYKYNSQYLLCIKETFREVTVIGTDLKPQTISKQLAGRKVSTCKVYRMNMATVFQTKMGYIKLYMDKITKIGKSDVDRFYMGAAA